MREMKATNFTLSFWYRYSELTKETLPGIAQFYQLLKEHKMTQMKTKIRLNESRPNFYRELAFGECTDFLILIKIP